MRLLFPIWFLVSARLIAQQDTVNMCKVRFDLSIEGSAFYGNPGTSPATIPGGAYLFLNSAKKYGVQDQYGLHICFYNKFSAEIHYTHDQFQSNYKTVTDQFRALYPEYFIQQHAKYGSYSQQAHHELDLRYFRFGLSGNIRLSKSTYFQPYAAFGLGGTEFPGDELVFKENTSNNVFSSSYFTGKVRTTGYVAGIRCKYYVDGNTNGPSSAYGHLGIKLEYSDMHVNGTGAIATTNLLSGVQATTQYRIDRVIKYWTIGVFIGFGFKGKKYANSFLFSSWPIKQKKKKWWIK